MTTAIKGLIEIVIVVIVLVVAIRFFMKRSS
jgi:hypothetical protein